jgi:hypothetical protein
MRSVQVSLAIMAMATIAEASGIPGSGLLTPPVNMRSAGSYAVVAAAATTAAGDTEVNGDFGQAPGVAVTAAAGVRFNGQYNHNNEAARQANRDLALAREDAASRTATEEFPNGALGGKVLRPGVYDSSAAFSLAGVLTFDAMGDPNATWILRTPAALTTAAASTMVMINGGCEGNVFWLLGAAATFGAVSEAIGTTMAYAAVTGGAGANFGPVFSSTAAVTLSNNEIPRSQCQAAGVLPSVPIETDGGD